ncbi:hypothetical protein VIGAN_08270900 [Vigna angularis var. angularis]|uniref:Cytokinin riboside 5'-monophosphate phosphoribohydrolase n=1 Tax=Vigna angularis var. angularis TaxID=157739 RepID=A0A0S3SSS3_PHAAN|nr:hypothetical protein VIGAN_08270900 [Vigna angularis var. angularis]
METHAEIRVSKFKRVCVFCGSSPGKKRTYQDAAIELGNELVSRNIDLVYGGGSIGLMGLVSQAVHDGGRHVIGYHSLFSSHPIFGKVFSFSIFSQGFWVEGDDQESEPLVFVLVSFSIDSICHVIVSCRVIPKTLMPRELTGETVGEVKAVADMHQRKAEMAKHSDAFIALPGGYGTLEELLEVITWAQLGIHDKPVGLVNVDGYFNSLLSFIDKAVEEGFISPNARHIIVSAPTSKELVKKLEDYVPCHESVASKLSWQMEQQLTYPEEYDISR